MTGSNLSGCFSLPIIDFFDRGWRINPKGTAYIQDDRHYSFDEVGELSCRIAGDQVSEARFRAFGCPHFLAAASWLPGHLRGARRDEIVDWDWREAADALEVPAAKFGRLLTLQDAARAAAGNWPGGGSSTV